ncbi:MAG: hypothetical protein ACYC54_15245 [Sedimentisphaerales bacterium]
MVRQLHSSDDGGGSLRDRLFSVLNENKVSADKAIKVLSQCEAHIRNRLMIEAIVKECGLKLSRFLMNDELELYYDIKRGRHSMGYISKGWEDPGFRIGDLIEVPKHKMDLFKTNAYQILKFCAINGIGMTVSEIKGAVEIQMDGVIYSEGFNKGTFMKTLETLNDCVEKAELLLAEE